MLIPEFAPQSGVLLTWPHAQSDWGIDLPAITPVYIEIARAVSTYEHLLIVCYDPAHRDTIVSTLAQAGVSDSNIRYTCCPSNDTWIRDYGPLAATHNGQLTLHDFIFDGWDGRYEATLDNQVTQILHAQGQFGQLPMTSHSLVLEGGSVDTDGQGTLLSTTRCLLHSKRNAGMTRRDMETTLSESLGTERVLWLEHGEIIGDDTDGHIDMLARFCSADTIAYCTCEHVDDPHYQPLRAMQAELQSFCQTSGLPYQLVPLPLPAPCYGDNNQRLPASYANFLIINDAVLMPTYNDPADDLAMEALEYCFPARRIMPIDCGPLIVQSGSLHCATLQVPAGSLPPADD